MNASPAAETPVEQVVVDREGSEGRRTKVILLPGTPDYPTRLHTALGYDGGSTIALSRDEATALIEAIRVQLRESDCSARCASENDVHGKSRPDRGWHRDDCPAILERTTIEDLYGNIAELVLELEEAGAR